jgi:hypothetical protein
MRDALGAKSTAPSSLADTVTARLTALCLAAPDIVTDASGSRRHDKKRVVMRPIAPRGRARSGTASAARMSLPSTGRDIGTSTLEAIRRPPFRLAWGALSRSVESKARAATQGSIVVACDFTTRRGAR